MDLSPFQRFVTFTVMVVVLAGLGVYMFVPQQSAARPARSQSPGQSAPGHSAGPSAPGHSAGTGPGGSGATDIYQWLPFTASGLAKAARITTEFAADYGTFSYQQSTASYLAPMRPLASSQLASVIGRAFAAPGLAATRVSTRQIATATVSILALRAFGPTSLTFVVTITQRITNSKGRSQQATDYAVTLTGSGTSWQVSDIELASVGNL